MRFDDIVANHAKRDEKILLVAANYRQYERRRFAIGIAVSVPLIAIFSLLLWRIVTAPTDIGAPVTESESVVRANERLLEMIKWTITTLLIGSGALIGLNWYTSEARYNLDRAIGEQERVDYRLSLEAAMSIAIGTVEDEMEEMRERMFVLEHPDEDLQISIVDCETGEYTFMEFDTDLESGAPSVNYETDSATPITTPDAESRRSVCTETSTT